MLPRTEDMRISFNSYLVQDTWSPPPWATYLKILQDSLPLFFDDVPLQTRRQPWLMHDGAPAHSSLVERDYLNHTFSRIGKLARMDQFHGQQDHRI